MNKELSVDYLIKLGLNTAEATQIIEGIEFYIKKYSGVACWSKISKEILRPDFPFEVHQLLFDIVYADWDETHGPKPVWIPSDAVLNTSNIKKIQKRLGIDSYTTFHTWSIANKEKFWDMMVKEIGINFQKPYSNIIEISKGLEHPKWLVGAMMNITDSCFKDSEKVPAIIYQQEGGEIKKMSYKTLDQLSNRVANGLINSGFRKGDAIAIDMVMTAESVAIYLGIIKAGCVVVSIADSLAPNEVAKRLQIANAKALFTQDFIIRAGKELPLYEKILTITSLKMIVLPAKNAISVKLRDNDITWDKFLSDKDVFEPIVCEPSENVNILFSSGTTGDPKAIPWTHTTPIKCAVDGYLHHNIQEGDIVAWPSNLGWMMGPWLIFAALINKATIALYYDAPTGREFGKFVQDAKINMLGVVPSIVKQWKTSDCMKGLDWNSIKAFSSTGESSNYQDMFWLMMKAGYKPIIEYCGGTEIGGGYVTGTLVQPAAPSYFTTSTLGLDFLILDENNEETTQGEVFLKSPSIGLSLDLLNQDHHEVYYANSPKLNTMDNEFNEPIVLRKHGDEIEKTAGGFYRAHGRIDDTMNLGGIKVSSVEIERLLNQTKYIKETAAIAVSLHGGGPSKLVVFAIPEEGTSLISETLQPLFQQSIKKNLNPLFKITDVIIFKKLPRTASNKVMRRVLREEYEQAYAE